MKQRSKNRTQGARSSKTLTEREFQIVTLVAKGNANKQIADQLRISEWTVSSHLRRIFAKLGVNNRSAMIYQCALQFETDNERMS